MQIIKNATACPKPIPQDVRHNSWENCVHFVGRFVRNCESKSAADNTLFALLLCLKKNLKGLETEFPQIL